MKKPLKITLIVVFSILGLVILSAMIRGITMTEKEKLELNKRIEAKNKKDAEEIKAEKLKVQIEKGNALKVKAVVYSHICVEQNLKSPSSAEYPYGTDGVVQINDSIFVVNSYVDSQNGFGAMLRTKYRCKLTILNDDKFICINRDS